MSEDVIYGWAGKIAVIDLTNSTVSELNTLDYAKDFIGSRGICERLYWDFVKPEVKALDPENAMICVTSPFTGCAAPCAPKLFAAFKSPATYPHEELFISNIGGHFAPVMKRAGYDGFILTGKAPKHTYIAIIDGEIKFCDADQMIWGLDTFATKDALWNKYGREAEIMTIGQAGENLVLEAIVQTGANSSLSQGGSGAVWGSKNLKAIVVKGEASIAVAKPQELLETVYECSRLVSKKYKGEDDLPANPFRNLWGNFPSELYMENEAGTAYMKPAGCDGCPMACKTAFRYHDGWASGAIKCSIGGGLYSKAAFGAAAGDDGEPVEEIEIPDGPPFMKIDRVVCDATLLWEKYGINGHFLEMYSQGLDGMLYKLIDAGIINEDNCPLPLDKVGETEFARELLRTVALRDTEFGDALAEGSARFCEKMGPEAMKIWYENYYQGEGTLNVDQMLMTKDFGEGNYADILNRAFGMRTSEGYAYFRFWNPNLDMFAFDEDKIMEMKRTAAQKLFGDEHVLDDPDDPDNGLIVARYLLKQCMLRDATSQCAFVFPNHIVNYTEDGFAELYTARLLNAILGTDYTEEQLSDEHAMRILNMNKLIQLREGRQAEDDYKVPDVFFTDGGGYYDRETYQQKVREYRESLGWDPETALPKMSALKELGLGEIAEQLEAEKGIKLPA